jgi:AraC-like DNA-binding protein
LTTRLTTAAVDARDGFDYWNDAVSSTFVPLDCRAPVRATFRGEIVNVSVGDVQFTKVTAAAHEVRRTRATIARNDPGLLKACVQLRGSGRISQDGRQAELQPGDLTIYDTSRPYTLSFDGEAAFGTLVVMFAGEELGLSPDDVRRVTAIRVGGHDGLGAVISPLLVSLAETTGAESDVLSPRLARNVLSLLETMYRERAGAGPGEPERMSTARLIAIQDWLERRLGDPELSPESIAAAHHISLRYLHRLFAAEQTSVSRWVKERRLEACRRDLGDPSLVRFSVAAIAARWGILDAAAFSRSFRTAFGLSPREYRMRTLGTGTQAPAPAR